MNKHPELAVAFLLLAAIVGVFGAGAYKLFFHPKPVVVERRVDWPDGCLAWVNHTMARNSMARVQAPAEPGLYCFRLYVE